MEFWRPLRRTYLPVLGVRLGHQAIAHVAGADVGPARQLYLDELSRAVSPWPAEAVH